MNLECHISQRKTIVITIILIAIFFTVNYNIIHKFDNDYYKPKEFVQDKTSIISLGLANETDAPVISFIQPDRNNTIISQTSYSFIVNITDENPPLFGNVTFQLSNSTTFLFNSSMSYDEGSQWSFNWNNISSYPNQYYTEYIIQIWAIDNSSNYNLGWSEVYSIFLNIQGESPGIINVIIYLILVTFIIAGIVVYLNKKLLPKSSEKKGLPMNAI
ncbi:MAG: hypothetical protein ACFE9Z_05065 [Promethearchaeota archaeon]